eukprot:scaffold51595_cov58-Attheya_sp.AAC.2
MRSSGNNSSSSSHHHNENSTSTRTINISISATTLIGSDLFYDPQQNHQNQQIPSSSDNTVTSSEQQQSQQQDQDEYHKYKPSLGSVLREVTCVSLWILMNAAVTIFGVGVGVGLILGDSIRISPTTNANNHVATTTNNVATSTSTLTSAPSQAQFTVSYRTLSNNNDGHSIGAAGATAAGTQTTPAPHRPTMSSRLPAQ